MQIFCNIDLLLINKIKFSRLCDCGSILCQVGEDLSVQARTDQALLIHPFKCKSFGNNHEDKGMLEKSVWKSVLYQLYMVSVMWCFGGTWTLFSNNDDPQCAWTIFGGSLEDFISNFFPPFLPIDCFVFPLLLFFSYYSWCNYGILENTAVVSLYGKCSKISPFLPILFFFSFSIHLFFSFSKW